jgi:hypothetical protein
MMKRKNMKLQGQVRKPRGREKINKTEEAKK